MRNFALVDFDGEDGCSCCVEAGANHGVDDLPQNLLAVANVGLPLGLCGVLGRLGVGNALALLLHGAGCSGFLVAFGLCGTLGVGCGPLPGGFSGLGLGFLGRVGGVAIGLLPAKGPRR